jgi:hypothetical protein
MQLICPGRCFLLPGATISTPLDELRKPDGLLTRAALDLISSCF